MPFYGSIFQQKSQLELALEKLEQHGFSDDSIQIISDVNKHSSVFPSDYDPLGGARFAGTNMTTMAATGLNIIGNSSTVDVGLDKLPKLLSELVESESTEGAESARPEELSSSYLLIVEADDQSTVQDIVNETGGILVDIDNFHQE